MNRKDVLLDEKNGTKIENRTSARVLETRINPSLRAHATDETSGAFNSLERLLSVEKTAKRMGVGRTTIFEYLKTGFLHRVYLPHPSGVGVLDITLIDVVEIDALINRCPRSDVAEMLNAKVKTHA
jgi:hypothetical protein